MRISTLSGEESKIDLLAVDGLLGVPDSLAYITDEIHKHFHNNEYWFGPDGAGGAARDNADFWTISAGTALAYGTEVQVYDGVTPLAAWVKVDMRKILIKGVSAVNKLYTIQFWNGPTTFAESTFNSEEEVYFPAAAKSSPITIMTRRIAVADKMWVRCRCETNSGSLDMRIGAHGYVG